MRSAGWYLLAAALAGCGSQPRGVKLDLHFSTSCPATPKSYDLQCVEALEGQVLDEDGVVLSSQCNELSSATFVSAYELVNSTELVPVLENVAPRAKAMIGLRGYHARLSDLCQEDGLMFWGRSDVIDLTDLDLTRVDIDIECRDDCDCESFADEDPACPLAFGETQRVCAPTFECGKSCDSTPECWDSAAECVDNVCRPLAPGQMCDDCFSANDCGDGLACVRHTTTSPFVDETFCALLCPAEGLTACPGRMGCLRVDGEELTILP